MNRLWLLFAVGVLPGCPTTTQPPGDESLGTYLMHAEGLSRPCTELKDIDVNGFDFTATISRFRDGGGAFISLNGVPSDAGFDGQFVFTTRSASRSFTQTSDAGTCAGCEMRLVESMTFALLSKSQSSSVGDKCPENPLDGGVPGLDAGVTLPGSTGTGTGFDALRACGDLHEDIVGTGSCAPECNACKLTYRLTGARQ